MCTHACAAVCQRGGSLKTPQYHLLKHAAAPGQAILQHGTRVRDMYAACNPQADLSCCASVVAKLADFGLSTFLDVTATHVSNWRKGTPCYMAPEVKVGFHFHLGLCALSLSIWPL